MSAPEDLSQLAEQLGSLLLARGLTLSLAESCTGGLGAEIITRVAGSSAWFECAVVSYSNASKVNLLKVASDTLDKFGAVSEQTAVEMASGVMAISGSQLSAAVTGIAGPGGGTPTKPVGTVCFGWATDKVVHTERLVFAGDRYAVRMQTTMHALKGLLRFMEQQGC